jgi:hypothetical protein
MSKTKFVCGFLSLLIGTDLLRAAEPPDLGKIDRRIRKEPAYKCKEPLYALYVFGPEAKTRVWAVLDKSKADVKEYDVLYFDRNGDGELTAPDERIAGKGDGERIVFALGAFTDPVAKQTHTELSISRVTGDSPMTMLKMKWCDKVLIRGGYASEVGPYTQFGKSPAEAPILWPGADGPLTFQFWELKLPLPIGAAPDLRVFVGHQGRGKNTFCTTPDTFLPKSVPVLATLVYTDKNGKEQRARSELRERC